MSVDEWYGRCQTGVTGAEEETSPDIQRGAQRHGALLAAPQTTSIASLGQNEAGMTPCNRLYRGRSLRYHTGLHTGLSYLGQSPDPPSMSLLLSSFFFLLSSAVFFGGWVLSRPHHSAHSPRQTIPFFALFPAPKPREPNHTRIPDSALGWPHSVSSRTSVDATVASFSCDSGLDEPGQDSSALRNTRQQAWVMMMMWMRATSPGRSGWISGPGER